MMSRIKYYWFIFRWFLIGKYHCKNAYGITYKTYHVINVLLWCFIVYSITMTVAVVIDKYV